MGLVLGLSLGAAAVSSTISFLGAVTAPAALAEQATSLVDPHAAQERPWLDLTRQLYALVYALVPVALVVYLLRRSGESRATIGFDIRRRGFDFTAGALLAALIGIGGLVVYVTSYQLGWTRPIVPSTLNDHWWVVPVLLAQALKNAVLEEVIVVGYLMHRLGQLGKMRGWPARNTLIVAILLSAGLRALYHLYQGLGMAVGNLVMGVVFCWFYHRFGRVMPLVIAHALIDVVAFLGALYLLDTLSWLP
ncbi:CPBP family intramembrane glutamic endopeptidase [Lipingzhangella sp. LS1_29]|uniref:CPBP family intramembrane glutamic endopeptidase n=2 Tax=Lipingzhangella rawalii TaxID=2055835 RepID=A0ABU2H213_9ACTN|nr:CPBP family intramembrane glutamic endopeptidase [Lipingzhangella rawalii]MDS1268899.1 CPBP family intramembrane glutamic endopeptidase [Lipingzhangella rawalii]